MTIAIINLTTGEKLIGDILKPKDIAFIGEQDIITMSNAFQILRNLPAPELYIERYTISNSDVMIPLTSVSAIIKDVPKSILKHYDFKLKLYEEIVDNTVEDILELQNTNMSKFLLPNGNINIDMFEDNFKRNGCLLRRKTSKSNDDTSTSNIINLFGNSNSVVDIDDDSNDDNGLFD